MRNLQKHRGALCSGLSCGEGWEAGSGSLVERELAMDPWHWELRVVEGAGSQL